jgi:hypothetical protein
VVFTLLVVPSAYANHEHPGAPCWSNGYGDGTDDNHIAHPYIHYAGDASCGMHYLETNLRISLHYMYGALGSGQWTRVYYNHCGFGYNCHATLSIGDHDCKFAADIYAVGPLADHWHYHHAPCVGIPA